MCFEGHLDEIRITISFHQDSANSSEEFDLLLPRFILNFLFFSASLGEMSERDSYHRYFQ